MRPRDVTVEMDDVRVDHDVDPGEIELLLDRTELRSNPVGERGVVHIWIWMTTEQPVHRALEPTPARDDPRADDGDEGADDDGERQEPDHAPHANTVIPRVPSPPEALVPGRGFRLTNVTFASAARVRLV